jgi:hypothetical protein
MADYAISNVPRRVVYTNSGVGPYAFTFEILSQTDISVYRGSTLLTLTTNYSVTINANGTGSVTLVTAGTGNITIVGAKNIQRTTDFTTGGDLFANTLNDELDNQTIFIQQVAETAERGLKAPVTDPTDIAMSLPAKDSRKGKVLAFDSTTGNPVAGPALDAVVTVIEQSANINTVADNIGSVNTVAGNTSNINTVAGASGNITTVASNIAAVNTNATNIVAIQNASTNATNAAASAVSAGNAQTAAEAARDATLAAYDSFDDRYLGAKSSNPSVDNDGNALLAGALYYNTTVPEMRLYTGSAWVAAYVSGASYLSAANNLSDLTNTATARTNLGVAIGTNVQAYDAELQAISTLSANGIVTRTSGSTAEARTITGTTNVITVTNGDGVSGNPTLTVGSLVARTDTNQSFSVSQRGAITALTDGATITPNMNTANNFSVTLGGNRTLANPTNLTAGQSGVIVITQDGTGSRTLAYGSNFKFPGGTAPTLTTTASAVDVLAYYVESATRITARLVADVK